MNQFIKTLLLTAALFAGFAALTWTLSKDKVPYFGNTQVLDQREITAITSVGPFGNQFLVSQKMDMDHINFRDEFLDRPICLSLFLDNGPPPAPVEHVPFKLALVGDQLNVVKVLSTAVIKKDFGRIDEVRRTQGPIGNHVIDEFVAGRLSRRSFIRRAGIA